MLRNLLSGLRRGARRGNGAGDEVNAPSTATGSRAEGRERRRSPRAAYERDARLEATTPARLEGVDKTAVNWRQDVHTKDASTWGVGLVSSDLLKEGDEVVLVIAAPDGTPLRVCGKLLNVRRLPRGEYAAGMAFHEEQPLLSAARIDETRRAA